MRPEPARGRPSLAWFAAVAALSGALCVSLLAVSAARAISGAGPRETVDVTTSTTQPNASAGLGYSAAYHAPGDARGDPPALRRLVIVLPPGTRIDTSVPARCAASDMQLMLMGESACPPSSRVGSGQATVKMTGLGTMTYATALYNAADQQLELVESGNRGWA